MKIIKSLLLGLFLVARFECSASVRSYESCLSAKELYNHALFKQGLVLRRFHNHDVNGVQQCSEDHFCCCQNASRQQRLELADQIVSDACVCLKKSEPVFLTSFGAAVCNFEVLTAQLLKNYGFVDVRINAIDPLYAVDRHIVLASFGIGLHFKFPIKLFADPAYFSVQPEENHIFLRVDMQNASCSINVAITRLNEGLQLLDSESESVVIESGDVPKKRLYAYSRNPLCFVVEKIKGQDALPDVGFVSAGDGSVYLCKFLQQESYGSDITLSPMVCPTFYKLLPQAKLAYEIDEDEIRFFRTALQDYLVYDGTQGAFLSPKRD
jgi:hypothetical protein